MKKKVFLGVCAVVAVILNSCASYRSEVKQHRLGSATNIALKEKDSEKRIAMLRELGSLYAEKERFSGQWEIDAHLLKEYPNGGPEQDAVFADMKMLASRVPLSDLVYSIVVYNSVTLPEKQLNELVLSALEANSRKPFGGSVPEGVTTAAAAEEYDPIKQFNKILAWKSLLPENAPKVTEYKRMDMESIGDSCMEKKRFDLAIFWYTQSGNTAKVGQATRLMAEQKAAVEAAELAALEQKRPQLLADGEKAMTEGRYVDAYKLYTEARDPDKQKLATEGAEKQLVQILEKLDNSRFPSMWGDDLRIDDAQARSVSMTSSRLRYPDMIRDRVDLIVSAVEIRNAIPDMKPYYAVAIGNQFGNLGVACWDSMNQGIDEGLMKSTSNGDIDYWTGQCRYLRNEAINYWEIAVKWYEFSREESALDSAKTLRNNIEVARNKKINGR